MAERMLRANGIDISAETFGVASDPPLLLVMGAGASMLLWEDDFCLALAAGGRHVIRFDNRDIGPSTLFDFATEPYTVADLTADAVGVLDALGVESAHVVGASMGGMIAQHMALDHRNRVSTITVMMSTPDPSGTMTEIGGGKAPVDALPRPSESVLAVLAAIARVDPSDPKAIVESRVELFRAVTGSADTFDETHMRELFTRERARAVDFTRSQNHSLAIARTPPWRSRLAEIDVPALVIHGTEDPLVPLAHGEAIAAAISGAELLRLEGIGHTLGREAQANVVPPILRHTSRGPKGSLR